MSKITISMPDPMSDYVARRVNSGQYGNVSEFFRDLVRRDQQRQQALDELGELVDAAEASDINPRQVPEIMTEIEHRLRAHGKLPADQ